MVYPRLILKELTKVFEEESFDLIHTHHPMFVGMTALYLGRKYQLPVIYTDCRLSIHIIRDMKIICIISDF